ncbi:MAG: helix-turn-helix domain-containing protein [Clostridiales bacterium]|nr:helix-turn-helix domain-containing protein [Clostridiales bacterium]
MPEREFNKIFSERLRYFLNKYEMTQLELSKRLGVGTTSVYNWTNGIKTPRMDKVDAMCQIFHCRRSDLMEEPKQESQTDDNELMMQVSPLEKNIIIEYRRSDDITQAMVLRALSLEETEEQENFYAG